jgi:hypothetical protein
MKRGYHNEFDRDDSIIRKEFKFPDSIEAVGSLAMSCKLLKLQIIIPTGRFVIIK